MKKYFAFGALLVAFIVFLQRVFTGGLVLPQDFSLGIIRIHYYGLAIASAALAGFYFAIRRSEEYGINGKQAEDILFWVIVGGFIGARLYHVLSSGGYYWHHPLDVLKVWNGGLSIYGVIIGGILSLVLLGKIFNFQFSIFNVLDWLVPSVLLGQIIGRLGNLFNYELFGYPTRLPWHIFVPEKFRPEQFLGNSFFHPLFLYEMLWNTAAFVLLLYIEKRRSAYPGSLFFFYLLLYNLGRFFLEFLRIDSVFYHQVRVNAWISFSLAAVSAAWILYNRKNVFVS